MAALRLSLSNSDWKFEEDGDEVRRQKVFKGLGI